MCCLQEDARPEPCNKNLIINELIREYLIFNGYRDTLSVFLPGACCWHLAESARCAAEHPNNHVHTAVCVLHALRFVGFDMRADAALQRLAGI
jgi:hypothetical protein